MKRLRRQRDIRRGEEGRYDMHKKERGGVIYEGRMSPIFAPSIFLLFFPSLKLPKLSKLRTRYKLKIQGECQES